MKEFKTISEQVAILESRGMLTDKNTFIVLLRENYYSVVNGYKNPFLDKVAMQSSSDDIFKPNTEFNWLYGLFKFDRELRQITFSYLIQAEAALKAATIYAFCKSHRRCSSYLDRSSFCSSKDMLTTKTFKGNKASLHTNNLNTLMRILNNKLVINASTRPFISHYMKTYGEVPLWVLANDLTFGNVSHFFQLMNRSDQNSVCKYLFRTSLRGKNDKRITPHEVLRAFSVLTHFRNLCAHDERLYCANVGGDTYATMLKLLEIALPFSTVNSLKADTENLLRKYETDLQVVTSQELKRQLGLV